MNSRTKINVLHCYILVSILLAQVCSTEALAASVLAFTNNQGSFSIQANNLNRMTSAEIRINYQVTGQAEKAQITLYPNLNYSLTQSGTHGYLEFKLVYKEKVYTKNNPKGQPNPLPRLSGDFKLLAFVRIPGDITVLSATICTEKSNCEFLQGSVTNPIRKDLDDKNDIGDTGAKTGTTDSSAPSTDNITTPSSRPDAVQPDFTPAVRIAPPNAGDTTTGLRENRPETGVVASSSGAGSTKVPADQSLEVEESPRSLSFVRRESLFERFGASDGERTAATLTRLLGRTDHNLIQEPPLLLSDGGSSIRLTVHPHGSGKQAPQFFIYGSRCVDVVAGENGAWILELVPEAGSLTASVLVLADSEAIEYPLAVVPPLEMFDAKTAAPGLVEYVRAANEMVHSAEPVKHD